MHPLPEDVLPTTIDDRAKKWARQLEDREIARFGLTRVQARVRVADKIGASPGTLENLSRDRLKGVRGWLYSRLLAAVTASVGRELAALQHEHEKLLALGEGADGRALEEVAQGISRLRGLLTDGGGAR